MHGKDTIMPFSLLSISLILIFAIITAVEIYRYINRGLNGSLLALGSSIVSLILSLVFSPIISGALVSLILSIAASMVPSYSDVIPQLPSGETAIKAILTAVLNSLLFLIVFFVFRRIVRMVIYVICKITDKKDNKDPGYAREKESWYVKYGKVFSGIIGALSGFILFMLITSPIFGTIGTVVKVADLVETAVPGTLQKYAINGEIISDMKDDLENVAGDAVGNVFYKLGGEQLYEASACADIDYRRVYISDEIDAAEDVLKDLSYPNLEYSDPNDKYNGDNIESYITSNLGEERNEWTVSENTFTVSSAPFGDYSDAGDYSWTLDDDSDIVIKLGERDVTDNFYISYGPTATQTIEKRDITLTPRLYHRDVYDGNPLDIEILYGDSNTWKLGDGNIFVVSVFFDKYCNAGTYSLSVTDGIAEAILSYTKPVDSGFSNFTISSDIKITSGERIVTDNFNISFEPNYVEITINQRSVSFKPSDVSEVYNGDFHTASKIEEAEKPGIGLLSEHNFEYSDVEFSYTYTDESGAEQTSGIGFKGKSNESTVATVGITGGTIKIYDGTSDVTDNYVINKSTDTGNLTVLALILHVKPVVSDKVFDGEVITSSSREYEWENFDGGSYEIVIVNQAVSDGVNVNKSGYDVEFKAGDIEVWDNGENITDSIKLVFESAKAFIKPRPVYITTGSAEKEYDGTELNCHSWELHPTMNDGEIVGLIEGYSKESIKVNFTGSQTDAGSSENTAIAHIDGNFTVEVVPGTLTVTPCKINITLAVNKSVYNGKPITTGIKYKIDCAVKDKIFVDITQINVINVGESFDGEDDLVYTVQWKDTGEYLDSDNYEVSVTASKIYRTQAEITVASHSFTENYEEGKVYKDNALDVTDLPEGHYFEGKATTSIKGDPNAVTTVPNEFDVNDVKIYNSEDEDVTANFKITPVFGTITVIPVQ